MRRSDPASAVRFGPNKHDDDDHNGEDTVPLRKHAPLTRLDTVATSSLQPPTHAHPRSLAPCSPQQPHYALWPQASSSTTTERVPFEKGGATVLAAFILHRISSLAIIIIWNTRAPSPLPCPVNLHQPVVLAHHNEAHSPSPHSFILGPTTIHNHRSAAGRDHHNHHHHHYHPPMATPTVMVSSSTYTMPPSPLHSTHTDNIPVDHHHHTMESSASGSPSRSLWERRNRNPRKAPSLPAPPRRHSPGYSMMPDTFNSPRKTSAPELSPSSGGGRQSTPHTPRLGASSDIDGSYHATAAMARSTSDQNLSSTASRSLRPRVDGKVVVPATHRDVDSDTAMESPTEDHSRHHSNSHNSPNSKPVIELGRRSDRHPVLDTPRASAASGREQRQDDSAMDTPRGSHHEYDFQQARRSGTIVSRNGSRSPSLPSAMSMHRYSVASSGPRSAVSSGLAGSRTPSTPGYASPSGGEFAVRSPRVFSEARISSAPYSRSSSTMGSSTSSYPATPSGLAIAPHHHHLFPRGPPGSPRNFSPRSPMTPAMPSPTLDHIPKDFVVKRLNKFAGTFWSNLSTSDVRLRE